MAKLAEVGNDPRQSWPEGKSTAKLAREAVAKLAVMAMVST